MQHRILQQAGTALRGGRPGRPEGGGVSRTADAQLAGFIDKFSPAVAEQARAALTKMEALLPGAFVLVYDNYNALAIGFGPTEKSSDAILSLAVYPRWVSLCFLRDGARLPDPKRVLQGSGKQVRHVVLESAADLDQPHIRALIAEALLRSAPPLSSAERSTLVIKSVSARQRPRRPPED